MRKAALTLLAIGLALSFTLSASVAHAVDPALKCEADKLTAAGKYTACLLKAEAKSVKTGAPPDFTNCEGKLTRKFERIETTLAAACPTLGDVEQVRALGQTCSEDFPGGTEPTTTTTTTMRGGGATCPIDGSVGGCQAYTRDADCRLCCKTDTDCQFECDRASAGFTP